MMRRLIGWYRSLHQPPQEHLAATQASRALLEETLRTDDQVDQNHQRALEQLCTAIVQARMLRATDRQNHYSESLTYAFRGSAS